MLDPDQLIQCNRNWTISLIAISCVLFLSLVAVILRGCTIRADAKDASRAESLHGGTRSFLWSDQFIFVSYVSTVR